MKKLQELYMYILGGLIVLGFFSLLIVLVTVKIPVENSSLINICVGALIGSFTSIVGYFFGSSQGSKIKTEMLNQKSDILPLG